MKNMKLLFLTLLLIIPYSCAIALDKVSIQLRWLHQFQFAGYYVAKEKGFYKEANFDVKLIEGGPHALKPTESVLNGKVDFAITGSGAVIERMEGKKIVALASIMQTSPIVWITLKSSNIKSSHDLADKNLLIMPPPESAELLTMLLREGIDLNRVNIKPTTFNLQDLIDGKADAYDGYISNEPYFLTQKGIEYNIINPRDYGINFYSDVLVTSEKMATKDPELIYRFKNATLKGWEYALNNIEETVQMIHQKYAPNKTLEHLRYEAETLKKLIMPELVQIGHMNPSRWQFIADSYSQLNMTSAKPNLDGFIFDGTKEIDYSLIYKIVAVSLVILLIAGFIIYRFRRLSMELKKSNKMLSELAKTDQLTKVTNRHGLVEHIPGLLSQARRTNTSCAFIMIDIDNFKQINDTYGHAAGDKTLVAFANCISAHRRKSDIVSRIGGEEFAVYLVGADLKQAKIIAEKMMKDIRSLIIRCPESNDEFSITASMGIALADGSLEEFCHEADKRLYKAKESGKNQIVI